jgi:hypothetical protein
VMWWSEVQRNGQSTVRPRRLRGGGKKEAAALRVSRGCRVRVRVLGAQEVPFVGRRRCPGRAGPKERRSPGISVRCAGEEEEGADARARGIRQREGRKRAARERGSGRWSRPM